ncbi:MAG: 1-acyl-sn-glycerol-3-phosphate acyltransferase [Deltaproteobacteria bacterium]|nr:1-acyl-sn-glycerol-3-phosphate acyltransferase [Deltaproteobacteria bacterium]
MQRALGRALSPLWVPAVVGVMRFGLRWRIDGAAQVRREYRELLRCDGPLIVCANHLTMVDSAAIMWALGSPGWFLAHYSAVPWNVPERQNFAASLVSRVLVYVMRCIPVTRGGDRAEVGRVLARLAHLADNGEVVLLFPEGGRSRSGRVESESAAYGVGRLIASLPGCRVLCVYLRGDHQRVVSNLPVRGERFRVRAAVLCPTSAHNGMRRALDLSRQVVEVLATLEEEHFQECGGGRYRDQCGEADEERLQGRPEAHCQPGAVAGPAARTAPRTTPRTTPRTAPRTAPRTTARTAPGTAPRTTQ